MAPASCFHDKGACTLALAAVSVLLTAISLGIGLGLSSTVNHLVIDSQILCNKNSAGYSGWENNRNSATHVYQKNFLYNMSNPEEYVQGVTAKQYELGPYIFRQQVKQFDVSFEANHGRTLLKYKSWDQYTFRPQDSCPGCLDTDEINIVNAGYLNILTSVLSESNLALSFVCTSTQIYLTTFPECTSAQRGTSALCHCCKDCSTLLAPENSTAMSMVSYLALVDRGTYVRAASPATKLFSTAVYSPLVVRRTVREVMLGAPSALAGFAQGVFATSSASMEKTSMFTADYAYVCSVVCANVVAFVNGQGSPNAQVGAAFLSTCDMYIPNTAEEMATLLNVTSVDNYVYLRGMSCSSYAFTMTARVLAKYSTGAACADASYTAGVDDCCLYSGVFSSSGTTISLKGWGCIYEVTGAMSDRVLESEDAARQLKDSDNYAIVLETGCGSKIEDMDKDRRPLQNVYEYKNKSVNNVWDDSFPSGGTFPNQYDVYYFSTRQTSYRATVGGAFGRAVYPKGLSGGYFSDQISNGEPLNNTYEVFPLQTRRPLRFNFREKTKVHGVNAAKFVFDTTALQATPENQAKGQGIPYAGLIMTFFYYNSPIIIHLPNFAYGDRYLLNQSDNTAMEAPAGGGIEIYRTVVDYNDNAVLASPELVTASMMDSLEAEEAFLPYVSVEPASGAFIDGSKTIAGTYMVWGCDPTNPTLTPFCGVSVGDGMCYESYDTFSRPSPCSAANVLTPNVMGGKYIPAFWNTEFATLAPSSADDVLSIGSSVQAARVFMIIGAGVGFFVAIAAIYVAFGMPQTAPTGGKPVKSTSGGGDVDVQMGDIYADKQDRNLA